MTDTMTQTKRKKLLLIDDDLDLLVGLKTILTFKGYDVVSASSSQEGVRLAKEIQPDLIICDIMMPNSSGHQVKDSLDSNERTSKIPFIFLTAVFNETNKITGLGQGADDYITKPFNIEELNSRIDSILRRYETGRQLGIREMEAAMESELRFRSLFDQNNDAVFILGLDGKHLDANRRASDLLGYTTEEITGLSVNEVSMEQESSQRAMKQLLAGEHLPPYERYFRKKDGQAVPVEINVELICNSDGSPKYIQSVVRDISSRKNSEEALRESEERFRAVIELSRDGILLIDEQGRIIEWNHAMEQITQIMQREAIGLPAWDVQFQVMPASLRNEATKEILKQSVLHVLETGENAPSDTAEITIENIHGEPRTILQYTFRFETKRGSNICIVLHDISRRKQEELKLVNAKEALETANLNLQAALEREKLLSRTDSLTGVNNRRHFFELAEDKLALASRYKQPLAVMMFDLDHFKKVNDSYGHDIGDKVLVQVLQVIREKVRTTDVIGRYGGEEFIILLPMTNVVQAHILAERIRTAVEQLRVPSSEEGDVRTSISIGITELDHDSSIQTVDELFRRADKALYGAKHAGRNCTVVFHPKG